MVPASILNRLASLATRERLVRFVWGAARLLAVVGVLLLVAGFVDWIYDRFTDTPFWLRVLLSCSQIGLAAVLFGGLVIRPLVQVLSYSELAGWVEQSFPALRGRVRSAVELNTEGAKTEGMSPVLIQEVTRQAERRLQELPLGKAIDGRRWLWAMSVVLPVALVLGLAWFLAPATCSALFQRQLLADVEIPRSIHLTAAGRSTWPNDEEVQVQFRATGSGAANAPPGTIIIQSEGLRETFALAPVDQDEEGTLYQATIPSPGKSFEAWAWVGDGRSRKPADITLEPRPGIEESKTWLILPTFVGTRSDGKPYEEVQDRGDIEGFLGCSARIQVKANKPLDKATLQILGPEPDGPGEREVRTLSMVPADDDKINWSKDFELKAGETAYRILMADQHGYENRRVPRRSITLLPDESPHVVLLPERFLSEGQTSFLEDSEVDGLPVLEGKAIRIGYRVRTNLSLVKANLRYRILKAGSQDKGENNSPWMTLPLTEVLPTAEAGVYDLNLGVWENNKLPVTEFTAVPSPLPELFRGRKEGGGRFDFKTRDIPELKSKDWIEYYVEVFDSRPGGKPGASEVRVKEVVDFQGLDDWIRVKLDEFKRLQQLESRQSGLFGPSSPGSP